MTSMVAHQMETPGSVVAPDLIDELLAPYKPHCRFLRNVIVRDPADNDGSRRQPTIEADGEFTLGGAWYIQDTGHFNAVEFNLCFNQLAYATVGHCVERGWLNCLRDWSLDDFRRNQLSNCLIVRLSSEFRRPMNATSVLGRFTIVSAAQKGGLVLLKTRCVFTGGDGCASGEVTLAIVKELRTIDD